jgi:plasmid stabilization system protein ParE
MGMQVKWTTRAEKGYDNIIGYLKEKWTQREIDNFIKETRRFLKLLENNPQMLEASGKRKNVYRGPMNSLTIITYRIKPRKKVIELLNVRSARKKPLKK